MAESLTFSRTLSDALALESKTQDDNFRVSYLDDACVLSTPFSPPDHGTRIESSEEDWSLPLITRGLSNPPDQPPGMWTPLSMLRRESARSAQQLESFMSLVIASSGCIPSTPTPIVDNTFFKTQSGSVAKRRKQAEKKAVLKDFLSLRPGKAQPGRGFNGCYGTTSTSPSSKAASSAPASALLASRTGGSEAPSSSSLSPVLAAALPCSLYAVSDYLETLHVWLSLALLARSLLLFLLLLLAPSAELAAFATGEVWPLIATATAAALIEVRWVSARMAAKRLRSDREAYTGAWRQVLDDLREQYHLTSVCKLSDHLRDRGLGPVRQCVVLRKRGGNAGAGVAEEAEERGGVTVRVQSMDQLHQQSMDQLHQQSMILQPMLRARVQWCAGRSHGWFKAKHPHSGRGQFVKWNEEAGMSEQVAWASTKTFKRSMAKVALVCTAP